MIEFSCSENKIMIKRNTYFLYGVFMSMVMTVAGVFVIFGLLPFDDGYTFANIFGMAFMLVWENGVVFGIVYYMGEYSKYVVISEDGVFCCTCFKKELVVWEDIKDWGLSYCGQTRGKGNTYYLYFSKQEYPIKNDCMKKLKGKMIKKVVFESDYSELVSKVIPFCTEKTNIMPFVGKNKYHFI